MIDDEFLQISIKLADGQFFPMFRCKGPQNCKLDLIPAQNDQQQMELHVYSLRLDTVNSKPVSIGSLHLQDLPTSEDMEVQFQAKLDINGLLTMNAVHKATDIKDSLVVNLISQEGDERSEKRGVFKEKLSTILGVIIIVTVLSLLIWVAFMIADWGQQKPDAIPVSLFIEPLKRVCFP